MGRDFDGNLEAGQERRPLGSGPLKIVSMARASGAEAWSLCVVHESDHE